MNIEKRLATSYPIRYEASNSPNILIYRDVKEYGLKGGEEIAFFDAGNQSFYAELSSYQGENVLLTVENNGKLLFCDKVGSISWGMHKLEKWIENFYNHNLYSHFLDNRFLI